MNIKLNQITGTLRVCVDQISDGRMVGRVVGRRLAKAIVFSDLGMLLLQIDAVLDAQNFPQAFQRIRTFEPAKPRVSSLAAQQLEQGMSQDEVDAASGAAGTFLLSVVTRRSATWQGFVDWLDGSPRQDFDSVLEFLTMVDQRSF